MERESAADTRTILHVDLDSFYAAVEQRDCPELRGRPVVVGGNSPRGVVAAASYEARRYGIHSAMSMATAKKRCADLIIRPPRLSHYRTASDRFFEILGKYSPLVESLSLDEAFVDVTGSLRLFGSGREIAERIRGETRADLGLTASVGVAASKFIAKIASDIDKPDGLRIVPASEALDFLHPLPVARLWGVGRVTQKKLTGLGLETIGDLAKYPESALARHLGDKLGRHLHQLARGRDLRSVRTDQSPVSIGHEETFARDRRSVRQLEPILINQSDRVASRLRRAELRGRVVQVKIRFSDFRTVTRRRQLALPSNDGRVFSRVAVELVRELAEAHENDFKIRLCGVSLSGLEDEGTPQQLSFDRAAQDRSQRLGKALDRLEDRFGSGIIRRGGATEKP